LLQIILLQQWLNVLIISTAGYNRSKTTATTGFHLSMVLLTFLFLMPWVAA